jgi:hypothetical protein
VIALHKRLEGDWRASGVLLRYMLREVREGRERFEGYL